MSYVVAMVVGMIVAGVGLYATATWMIIKQEADKKAAIPAVNLTYTLLKYPDGHVPAAVPERDRTVHALEAYVQAATTEASVLWEEYFTGAHLQSAPPLVQSVSMVLDRRAGKSDCVRSQGVGADFPYGLYCKEDVAFSSSGVVWLPMYTLYSRAISATYIGVEGYRPAFAAGAVGVYTHGLYVVEALWSHSGMATSSNQNHDLLAACFTGAWAGASRHSVSDADLAAAVNAVLKLGHPRFARHSAAELGAAFGVGYGSVQPLRCIADYWAKPESQPSPSASVLPSPSATSPAASVVSSPTPPK